MNLCLYVFVCIFKYWERCTHTDNISFSFRHPSVSHLSPRPVQLTCSRQRQETLVWWRSSNTIPSEKNLSHSHQNHSQHHRKQPEHHHHNDCLLLDHRKRPAAHHSTARYHFCFLLTFIWQKETQKIPVIVDVMVPHPLVIKNEMGGITVFQLQASDMNPLTAQLLLTASPSRTAAPPASSDTQPPAVNRPRRTGSLALFFRKVRKCVLGFYICSWMKIFHSRSAYVLLLVLSGVSFSQCASARPVSEAGYLIRAAREDLDVFWALAAALHWPDEGQAPGPASALCRLHYIKGTAFEMWRDELLQRYCAELQQLTKTKLPFKL